MHVQTYLHNNVTTLKDPPQLAPDFQVFLKRSQYQALIIFQPVVHTWTVSIARLQHSAQCVLLYSHSITLHLSSILQLSINALCNTRGQYKAGSPHVPLCGCKSPFDCLALQHADEMKDGLGSYLARSLRHSRNDALSLCSRISGDMSVVHAGRRGILSLQQKQNLVWVLVCCTCDLVSTAMTQKVEAASSEGCHFDCQKVQSCLLDDATSPGNGEPEERMTWV